MQKKNPGQPGRDQTNKKLYFELYRGTTARW